MADLREPALPRRRRIGLIAKPLKGRKMRICLLVILTLIAAGCTTEVSDSALATALRRPMTEHAAALAGDSVSDMRRTGRNVIAIYDAGVGRGPRP